MTISAYRNRMWSHKLLDREIAHPFSKILEMEMLARCGPFYSQLLQSSKQGLSSIGTAKRNQSGITDSVTSSSPSSLLNLPGKKQFRN